MDFLRNSFQKKDIEWIDNLRQKYPFPLEKNKNHLKMEDILIELGDQLEGEDCILTTGVGIIRWYATFYMELSTTSYYKWFSWNNGSWTTFC